MKILISLILLSISLNASAVFKDIWKGYLVSKIHQSQQVEIKLNAANFKFSDNIFDWNFGFTPSHSESNLASIFAFQAQKTTEDSMLFSLSKSSYKFGTFSLSHEKTSYDLSEWTAESLKNFADPVLYENRTSIEYSYDFLNRSSDIDQEIVEIDYRSGDLQSKINIEQGYLNFFSTYLQTKFQVYAVDLTKSFIKEAKRRVSITKRRFNDGTSRKVELLQARSSLLNQNESLEKNRSTLKQNLAILENIIGKRIDDSYFAKLTWKMIPFKSWRKYIDEKTPMSLDLIQEKIKFSEKQIEKMNNESGYKLTMNTAYITNALGVSDSASMTEAMSGDNTRQSISLNFVIPLGMDKRSALRERYTYQKKKNELELLNSIDEVKVKKTALIEQIKYLEKSNSFSKSKVEIATETLKEQNRLYLRGQASFEEVIRAEESYINAKLNEKRMLLDYELLIANYAFLNNSMTSLLNAYQD
jgi:outer membrane protein TolC